MGLPVTLMATLLVAVPACQLESGPRSRQRARSSSGLDPVGGGPGGAAADALAPPDVPAAGTGGTGGGAGAGSGFDASAHGPVGGTGGMSLPADAATIERDAGGGSGGGGSGGGGSGGLGVDASLDRPADSPTGAGGAGGTRVDARPDTSSSGGTGGFRPDAAVDRPLGSGGTGGTRVDAMPDTSSSGGKGGSGGAGGMGGSGGAGGSTGTGCDSPNLVWKTANKTWYTSYPDPGSEECIKYNGCMWAGQFSACPTKKSEAWVMAHNIVAFFPNFNSYKLHDLCLKSGDKTIVVTVYDTCGDSDCNGCCTRNQGNADALIDLESYTNARWGVQDGRIQWADLGPTKSGGCN